MCALTPFIKTVEGYLKLKTRISKAEWDCYGRDVVCSHAREVAFS